MLNSTDFANFLEIFQYHKIEKEKSLGTTNGVLIQQ
jgi:hypothetical protein